MPDETLPVGKLPAKLLAKMLARAPVDDPRIVLGPGIGLDCAVVDAGDGLLVFKSDPITFVTGPVGRYLVQVNANDVATTGAKPSWLLLTLLLPEGATTPALAEAIVDDVYTACRALGIAVIGGHTEITHGLDRPIAVATLVGEVAAADLVTPRGASPGDRILITKGVPIEGTSIVAREFPDRVRNALTDNELREACNFISEPGISVVLDAKVALEAGQVTAMHDPTEGGLAAALWELAEASGRSLRIDPSAVPIPDLSAKICAAVGIDPLATIGSGALLLTSPPRDASRVQRALEREGIACADIGEVQLGPPAVTCNVGGTDEAMSYPMRDEIARIYASEPE